MIPPLEEPDPYFLDAARQAHAHATNQLCYRIALTVSYQIRRAFTWARTIDVTVTAIGDAAPTLRLDDVHSADGFGLRSTAPDALQTLAARVGADLAWLYKIALKPEDWAATRTLDLHQPNEWHPNAEPTFDWQTELARYPSPYST